VCGCNSVSDCTEDGTGATCTNNVCSYTLSCTRSQDCRGSGQSADASCKAGTSGTCAPNSCTTNGQCAATSKGGQEQCSGGVCGGCNTSNDCPGSSKCVGATSGTCSGTSSNFPYECTQGTLDSQEAALEFMFFDLSACVTPNNQPPPGPPTPVTVYNPATFTVDFESSCPPGNIVRWRELDWQATIPATASIVFSAQTADAAADGGIPSYSGVQSVLLANATTTTPNLPTGWDSAIMDTSNVNNGGGTGLFNTAVPPVSSKADLRITITLNPTSDQMAAPTLIQWQVKSDCIAAE
jgi:hypothetical protein